LFYGKRGEKTSVERGCRKGKEKRKRAYSVKSEE
jgi:hypothetical protein